MRRLAIVVAVVAVVAQSAAPAGAVQRLAARAAPAADARGGEASAPEQPAVARPPVPATPFVAQAAAALPRRAATPVDGPAPSVRAGRRASVVPAGAGVVRFDDAPVAVAAAGGSGLPGGEAVVHVLGGARRSLSPVGLAFRLDLSGMGPVDGPVTVEIDYGRMGVPAAGDLHGRLALRRASDCERSAEGLECAGWATVATENDRDRRVLSARVDPAGEDGSTDLVLSAEESSEGGDFAATPLTVTEDYQVGLFTGAVETSYPFDLPPPAAGPAPELSLSYSSVTADGMNAQRNNQPGVAGVGWTLESGHVTRHLQSCLARPAEKCAYTNEFSITLNGTSSRLLPVEPESGGSGGPPALPESGVKEYRLAEDPRWRVERLRYTGPGERPHPDARGEYWRVTLPDGTRYRFGAEWDDQAGDLDSAFTTTVYSPQESFHTYCTRAQAPNGLCTAVWQWNLDRIEDPHGNAVTYDYAQEVNHYRGLGDGRADPAFRRAYVRAGHIETIDYTRRGDAEPHARVVFDMAKRCADQATDCSSTQEQLPDVPLDLVCGAEGSCDADRDSATFWTELRLHRLRTQVRDEGGEYRGVSAYEFGYAFSDTAEVEGATSSAPRDDERKLMLTSVRRVGGGSATDAATAAERDRPVTRASGAERITSAVEVSREGWDAAGTVLLARSDDFPDALAAAALAADRDAPLLLTPTDELPDVVGEEIVRLEAEEVVVLGGDAAVSGAVADAAAELSTGPDVTRLAGGDRYATAAAIAAAAPADEASLVSGANFPDALSAGALAATPDQLPVLLTDTDSVPEATLDALDELEAERVTVIGGSAVVADPVVEALEERDLDVSRLAGADRYATSLAVLADALGRFDEEPRPLTTATGDNFPDALAAGARAARVDGPLLLVRGDGLGEDLTEGVSATASRYDGALVVGGTAVVTDRTLGELSDALNGVQPGGELPPVTYGYRSLENWANPPARASTLPIPRLTRIDTELGGTVTFALGQPGGCDTSPPPYVRRTGDCFPAFVDTGEGGGPSDYGIWRKYKVVRMTSTDGLGVSPPEVTEYAYGTARYAYSDEPGLPNADGTLDGRSQELDCPCRFWSEFRGHDWVRVTDDRGVTEHRFYQGMEGDRAEQGGYRPHDAPPVTYADGSLPEATRPSTRTGCAASRSRCCAPSAARATSRASCGSAPSPATPPPPPSAR